MKSSSVVKSFSGELAAKVPAAVPVLHDAEPSSYDVSESAETVLLRPPNFVSPVEIGTPPTSLITSSRDETGISKQILVYEKEPLAQPQAKISLFETSHSRLSDSVACRNSRPVLYSAIGSLEDPGNSSYRWKRGGSLLANIDPHSQEIDSSYGIYRSAGKEVDHIGSRSPSISNQPIRIGGQMNHRSKPTFFDASEASAYQSTQLEKESGATNADENLLNLSRIPTQSLTMEEAKVKTKSNKKVTIGGDQKVRKSKKKQQVVEMFRPSSDAYTPRMGKKEIKYKPAELRTPVQQMATPLGTLSRPNFRDALKRVSMILRQHIVKIERRFEQNYRQQKQNSMGLLNHAFGESYGSHHPLRQRKEVDGLFHLAMKDEFSEDRFIIPKYKCTMIRIPMARMGMVCGLKHIRVKYEIPSEDEIYDFAHRLFKKVQLSSECSIVCLIYVERLMEISKVPLLANTWRPIFMCGLLLASKVWQDLSSWNIEFAGVYPQYSLDAINRLELQFLRSIKWELYISSSLYAKYYFALRSLVEKTDFRQRYNRMVGGVNNVKASTARKIEERTTMIKEEVLQQLSRSM